MLIQEDFVPTDVVHALSQGGVTRTTLVPAMIQACLFLVPDDGLRDRVNELHRRLRADFSDCRLRRECQPLGRLGFGRYGALSTLYSSLVPCLSVVSARRESPGPRAR